MAIRILRPIHNPRAGSGNWYITKIWIGFDNGISHATGQARTYFDKLHITYGVGQKIHFEDKANPDDNAWISACIEAADCYYHSTWDVYDLWLKIGIAGFDNGHVDYSNNMRCYIFPYLMEVSTDASEAAVYNINPTGVNLTREEQDPNLPPGEAAEFVLGIATLIASHYCPPLGATLTVISLATSFFGLLMPEQPPLYAWPEADWGDKMGFPEVPIGNWDPKNFIAGEVYIQIPGLTRGTHPFEFTFTVIYVIEDPSGPWQFAIPLYYRSCELTLNFEWSTTPDDVNLPPDPPSTPSGRTSGYTGTTYPYSANTTDPDGDPIRYEFWWGDGTTKTTGWYASGENATASHQWTSPGTYNVRARAQDYDGYLKGYWSGFSPILTVNITEPTLVTILNSLGFTNIEESTAETFIRGTYRVKLYAEFAGYHTQNELSWYAVGTTQYNLSFSGPEGTFGYVNPPIVKSVTINGQFGLSLLTPEARYFTETSKNPDGTKHAMIYRNLDNPNMYLIGFENKLGEGDKDYNDMVISLGCTQTIQTLWYFHKEMDTSVQGYEQLKVDVPCGNLGEKVVSPSGLSDHFLVGKWVTQPLPSQTIPSGTWTFHLWCYINTRSAVSIYAKIYKQHGSTQTLLATTNQAAIPFLAYGETDATATFPETQMAQGDKIIVEVWLYSPPEGRVGARPTVRFAYDTTNRNSRIDTTPIGMDILFYDSFEANLRQWQIITPTWQIENGELSGNGTIYTEPPEIEAQNLWINDFDLQLRFCRKTTWTYFDVVFRYTSSAQSRVRIYKNQIRVELVQSGSVTVLNSSTVDWDTDMWHSLQIIASGNSFTVYYDGSLKLKAVDPNSTISGGVFRLDVGHNQSGGPQDLHTHFDDILIRYC